MKYGFVQYYYQWIHHGDRYLQFEDQASQTQAGGGESPIMDKVALFYEAVGGEKKSRVYGTGSQKSIFYPQSSCSSSKGASSMELQSRIIQLENKNKELQESLQAIREDRDDYREQVMRQMENMMKDFEARMRSQFTHQAS
ncbi:hypothetical protein J5N97_028434 [Dioscorea zingiberensis]|uniref:Transposase n=1 Tax=Dioscorea zingiberensis TaxID=325984 RepID=A0A9D5BZF3_9LILI|nr:hypothetical protein J5N97_028434 [Dioscorea zingiberensis]